jgi:hypothetical protein
VNVYILGLANHFRGDRLLKHLQRFGIEPIVVHGFDARISQEFLSSQLANKSRTRSISKRALTLAEVAVVLGHRMIYERFLASNETWALILEDDSFPIESWVPESFLFKETPLPMIIHLRGIDSFDHLSTRFPCLLLDSTNLSCGPDSFFAYRTLGNLFGTYAYLINRPAAEVALANFAGVDSTADWPYSWRNKVNFYVPEKTYFTVSLEGSLVEKARDEALSKIKPSKSLFCSNRLIGIAKSVFGLMGLLSVIPFLKGLGFRQHYKENFIIPFLLRRVRSSG